MRGLVQDAVRVDLNDSKFLLENIKVKVELPQSTTKKIASKVLSHPARNCEIRAGISQIAD